MKRLTRRRDRANAEQIGLPQRGRIDADPRRNLLHVQLRGKESLRCAEPAKRPNILFMMSDDHCARAVGAYGMRLAKLNPTPNLDRLARGGMLFENVFCANSICTPSRATLMTGQYRYCMPQGCLRQTMRSP